MVKLKLVFLSFFALSAVTLWQSEAAKILFAGCQNSKSHMNSLLPLAKKLVANGHDVTYFMSVLEPMPEPGGGVKSFYPMVKMEEDFAAQVAPFLWQRETNAAIMFFIFYAGNTALELTVEQKSDEFWKLANDTWDMVVVDELFTMTGYGIALHIQKQQGTPIAVFSTTNPLTTFAGVSSLGRSPLIRPSFYVSNVEPFDWNIDNFLDRVMNLKDVLIEKLTVDFLTVIFSTAGLRSIGINGFSWQDYYSKVAINFVDYPDKYAYPEAVGSNYIYTGSICSSAKPLPSDLLEFVNDPKSKATIYIAFGSYVDWDYAPKLVLNAFIDAVNALKEYRIIWGFQGRPPTNLGSHVKILSWAPQNDILHHPKTKLFISHGGLKSVKEAICSETPILFVPIFAEQNVNSLIAKQVGYGETLCKFTITKDDIVARSKQVLGDERYLNVVKKTRALFVDRIVHPLDEGLFWTNKVIRYREKRVHFRRKGMDRRWHEYLFFDSLAFVFLLYGFVASK